MMKPQEFAGGCESWQFLVGTTPKLQESEALVSCNLDQV